MAKKRMTLRERLEEERRKLEEAQRGQKFKQRLVKVRIITRPFSLLHGMNIFYCGYCGKRVWLFSARPFRPDERIPPLYYTCEERCQRASFHRASFIDKLVMQLIQRRIRESFPEPSSGEGYEELLEKFSEIDRLKSERLELLNKLHYASYKRGQVLEQISSLDEKVKEIESQIEKYFGSGFNENPLLYPLFTTPPDNLNELDLAYRRKLVQLLVRRIRFFNEFLIVRMNPLTDEDRAKSDEMGRIFHINLRLTDRERRIRLPDTVPSPSDADEASAEAEGDEGS